MKTSNERCFILWYLKRNISKLLFRYKSRTTYKLKNEKTSQISVFFFVTCSHADEQQSQKNNSSNHDGGEWTTNRNLWACLCFYRHYKCVCVCVCVCVWTQQVKLDTQTHAHSRNIQWSAHIYTHAHTHSKHFVQSLATNFHLTTSFLYLMLLQQCLSHHSLYK